MKAGITCLRSTLDQVAGGGKHPPRRVFFCGIPAGAEGSPLDVNFSNFVTKKVKATLT